MATIHPRPDDHGKPVSITSPSTPSPVATWNSATSVATVTPNGPMPSELNGIAVAGQTTPTTPVGWEALATGATFTEPPFTPPKHKRPAAGVVIEESDGRIWLVAPSNAHGGYQATFPKGTVDPGASLHATAIREAFEEAGLNVELTGFFADSDRTLSFTRYYLARRTGGSPAKMGWESQAVHLVPRAKLAEFLTNPNDKPFIKLLEA